MKCNWTKVESGPNECCTEVQWQVDLRLCEGSSALAVAPANKSTSSALGRGQTSAECSRHLRAVFVTHSLSKSEGAVASIILSAIYLTNASLCFSSKKKIELAYRDMS